MKQLVAGSPQRQQGISKFGLMMLILLVAGVLTVGLKVGPLYIDNSLLTNLAEELVESGQAQDMSVTEIREKFGSTLRLNNISGFNLNDIRVARVDGKAAIRIAYERRVNLVGNLDIVAAFDTTIQ